jgi:hypothetical protein
VSFSLHLGFSKEGSRRDRKRGSVYGEISRALGDVWLIFADIFMDLPFFTSFLWFLVWRRGLGTCEWLVWKFSVLGIWNVCLSL